MGQVDDRLGQVGLAGSIVGIERVRDRDRPPTWYTACPWDRGQVSFDLSG